MDKSREQSKIELEHAAGFYVAAIARVQENLERHQRGKYVCNSIPNQVLKGLLVSDLNILENEHKKILADIAST